MTCINKEKHSTTSSFKQYSRGIASHGLLTAYNPQVEHTHTHSTTSGIRWVAVVPKVTQCDDAA